MPGTATSSRSAPEVASTSPVGSSVPVPYQRPVTAVARVMSPASSLVIFSLSPAVSMLVRNESRMAT